MRFRLLLAAVGYLTMLHVSYVYLVAPYFAYSGLDYDPASEGLLLWSWMLILLPVAWLPLRLKRPSLVVYYFVYTFVLAPGCIVPAYTGALSPTELVKLQISLLTCFALLGLVYAIPPGRVPQVRLSPTWFFAFIGVFSLATYVTAMHYYGFQFRFPNPRDVYDIRQDFADASSLIQNRWVAYCINWQALAVNPFLMAVGLVSRRYYLIALGFLGELAIYALGGLKQALFALALIGFLYLVMKCKHYGVAFLSGLTAFIAVCFVCDRFLFHTVTGLTSIFVRRMVFLDGQLTGMYFDFFSHNPYALLSQSILGGFVKTIYSMPLPQVIGAAYFGRSAANANGNVWADGYANFGYFGMLGATLVLGAVLWVVDSLGKQQNRVLIVLMLAMPAFVFSNSAVLTCLGNHGVGLMLVLLYLLPRELAPAEVLEVTSQAREHWPPWPNTERLRA